MSRLSVLTLEGPTLPFKSVPEYALIDGANIDVGVPPCQEVTASAMLRAVRLTPALTKFEITRVRVRVGEVMDILKHLGSQL